MIDGEVRQVVLSVNSGLIPAFFRIGNIYATEDGLCVLTENGLASGSKLVDVKLNNRTGNVEFLFSSPNIPAVAFGAEIPEVRPVIQFVKTGAGVKTR